MLSFLILLYCALLARNLHAVDKCTCLHICTYRDLTTLLYLIFRRVCLTVSLMLAAYTCIAIAFDFYYLMTLLIYGQRRVCLTVSLMLAAYTCIAIAFDFYYLMTLFIYGQLGDGHQTNRGVNCVAATVCRDSTAGGRCTQALT